MPPSSRTLGRWQIVVGGTATETQVCYVRPAEARLFVAEHRPPVHMGGENGAVHVDVPGQAAIKGEPAHVDAPAPAPMLTLSDAIAEGMCPWELSATQKRLQRARRDGRPVPTAVAKRQRADLYERQDLIAWFKSELVS